MRAHPIRSGAAALAAILLGACATPEPAPPGVNLSGFSAAFKQGYSDGCESAGARSRRRDDIRYQAEADYMMGWNDGYSACRRR